MSTLEEPTRDWQPTPTSTGIALAGTLLVVAALLWQVDDVARPVALGAVGAVLFAASCWLLARERFETVARPLVSVLTLPVALGLFGSAGLVSLLLASRLFPVLNGSEFSTTALVIAGHAGVVFGSVLALLGVTLGVRSVVTPTALRRYGRVTFLTALVPGLVCVALVAQVVVVQQEGPLTTGIDALALVWSWLTAADPAGLPLAGFLFTFALALTSVLGALVVLPAAGVSEDPAAEQRVRRLMTRLTQAAALVIALHLATLVLEFGRSEAELAALLGSSLYETLSSLATVRAFRLLLLAVVVFAVAVAALGSLARRLAQQSNRGFSRLVGPFIGGAFITLVAALVAEGVYETILELVLQSLPPSTESDVGTMATEAASLYGEELFVILLAFALVAVTLCFIGALRAALFFGSLSAETPGFSLAGAGLFVGVVAAATVGAPVWLAVGGVLGSLLVWDAGRFGSTLGREIGHGAATRDTELVHAGATLGVGLLGAVGAGVVASREVWTLPSATTSVALVALAAGLVCFVIALR